MAGERKAMTFRRKLLILSALTVFFSVAAVGYLVSFVAGKAFKQTEEERTAALVAQFRREFSRQSDEAVRRIQAIAASEPVAHIALLLDHGAPAGDIELARSMAENYQLDFLEFVDARGTIISSAQWPAKFGYPEAAFETLAASTEQNAFLKLEELQDSTALGLFAVRATRVSEHPVYVIGGRRLDKTFLTALDLPADMRVLLYQNRGAKFSADLLLDPAAQGAPGGERSAEKFAPLIDVVRQHNQEATGIVHWSPDQADDEVFHAIPLRGANHGAGKDGLLGVLLIGNSRRSYVELKRHIRASALLVGGSGIVLAILLSSWAAARVTRPVGQLARAAQEVAAGNWNTRVEVSGNDELAQLAESFNRMTTELLTQKERLVQTERVAAWRELARRLAHELKNPLFPLQLTVENLIRARTQSPELFEEIFRESSHTLLAEISNLKAIIGRFSEFSKMPHPQLQNVQVNEILRGVAQLFQAQLSAPGRAPIACTLELDETLGPVSADPELLHRAISNLVLNAMDAMPDGGKLILRSTGTDGKVIIEVADNGSGLTREECERIFTPYYTSKQHGTGLGLAIVQSVVSDHGGRISVQSEPGQGTTFTIELSRNSEGAAAATESAG
jgi:signal transduction histidine kinase